MKTAAFASMSGLAACKAEKKYIDVERLKSACNISWDAHQKTDEPTKEWIEKSSSYITG